MAPERYIGIACNILETTPSDILDRSAERLCASGALKHLSSIRVVDAHAVIEYLCQVRP